MATSFQSMISPARKGSVATAGGSSIGSTASLGAIGALPEEDVALLKGVADTVPAGEASVDSTVRPGLSLQHPPAQHKAPESVLNESSVPAPAGVDRALHPEESVFAKRLRLRSEAETQALARERDYTSSNTGPLASRVREEDRAAVVNARRDIHATKLVARLVAAIARKPGSGVPNAIKSQHLASLLRSVRDAASRLAASIAPNDAHRGWVNAIASEAALTMVATQWESDPHEEVKPIDVQLEALEGVFHIARTDEALSAAIEDISEARYIEAITPEIAQARILLSARMASWDLYSSVTHHALGKGAFRYSYGRTAAEVVERLMPDVFAIAKDNIIRTDSLDMRTAHMQGSLRRISDLLGAEYVTRTRSIMNWIAEEGISDDEYLGRMDEAKQLFEARLAPELIDWTRRNFTAVEAMAARLLEEPKNEQTQVQRHGQ